MIIFDFDDYKLALRDLLERKREQHGSRFTFEKMAIACGIQKTYLSRVLNGKGHLNPDQLFAACEFLSLREVEIDFLQLLRERQDSVHPRRLNLLKKKIEALKAARLKSENTLKTKNTFKLEQAIDYYTNFNLHLTHLLLTIPRFSASPQDICGTLNISVSELNENLEKLERWGLVKRKGAKVVAEEVSQHLPADSPVFGTFATLQRIKAMEKMNQSKREEDYFFSVLFSAEAGYQVVLRKKLLALLEEARGSIEKGKQEEVFQLNIDLFRWT